MRHTEFSGEQLDRYLAITDQAAASWMKYFPEKTLYSPTYWHLFCGMFKTRHEQITKGEAAEFLKAAQIKSSVTQAKVIEQAKKLGYVVETRSKKDKRSVILGMTPKLHKKMEAYLSETLSLLIGGLKNVRPNR
jgi:hypothetical protein